jgi:hypothetical protein
MHIESNHPGLKKYREKRAKSRAAAILRNNIRENNPNLSDRQVEEIAKASLRAKKARTIKVQGRKGKRKGKGSERNPKPKTREVKVQVVNRLPK